MLLSIAVVGGSWDLGRWTSIGTIAGLAVAFALTRSRVPELGGFLACVLMLLAIGILHSEEESNYFVYFLAVPILIGAVILPPAWTYTLLGVLAVLAAVDVAYDDSVAHGPAENLVAYSLVLVITGIAIGLSRINERHLQDLERGRADLQAANSKIQEQNVSRIRVLQELAHDLASPLTPVMLSLHVLRAEGSSPKLLDVIERNLNRQRRLIADVSDLARLEGGKLAMERQDCDLSELARETVESLQAPAKERGVHLVVDAGGDARAALDAGRISQVITNLVSNALKFTPPGKTIQVRTFGDADSVSLLVADQGSGMTQEQLGELFVPFCQVHDPAIVKRPEDKGTGLGLSICKGLVEAHGGQIKATSRGPGHGSTFTVTLPRQSLR